MRRWEYRMMDYYLRTLTYDSLVFYQAGHQNKAKHLNPRDLGLLFSLFLYLSTLTTQNPIFLPSQFQPHTRDNAHTSLNDDQIWGSPRPPSIRIELKLLCSDRSLHIHTNRTWKQEQNKQTDLWCQLTIGPPALHRLSFFIATKRTEKRKSISTRQKQKNRENMPK